MYILNSKMHSTAAATVMIAESSPPSYTCTVLGCSKEYLNAKSLKQHLKAGYGQTNTVKKGRFSYKECNQTCYHTLMLA